MEELLQMMFPKFRFWIIEGLAWWLEKEPPDNGLWLPPVRIMVLILALEGIIFLWISGAFRILG